MTPEKLKRVLEQHIKVLTNAGSRIPLEPTKLPEADYSHAMDIVLERDCEAPEKHAAWMCQQAIQLVDEGRIEKAMRWLGWINCTLWLYNHMTLDQIKEACAPDPDEMIDVQLTEKGEEALIDATCPSIVTAVQQPRQEHELTQETIDDVHKSVMSTDSAARVINEQSGIRVKHLNQAIQYGHLVGKLKPLSPVNEERAEELLRAHQLGEGSFAIPGRTTGAGTFTLANSTTDKHEEKRMESQEDESGVEAFTHDELVVLASGVMYQPVIVIERFLGAARSLVRRGMLKELPEPNLHNSFEITLQGRAAYVRANTDEVLALRNQVGDLVTEVSNLRKQLATQKAANLFETATEQDIERQAQLIRKGLGIPDDVQLGEHSLHAYEKEERAKLAKVLVRLRAKYPEDVLSVVEVRRPKCPPVRFVLTGLLSQEFRDVMPMYQEIGQEVALGWKSGPTMLRLSGMLLWRDAPSWTEPPANP